MARVIGRRVRSVQIDQQESISGALATRLLGALRHVAVVLAALAPLGILYGYGVALGFGSRLGLDSGIFFSSVSDLLVLAGRGLLGDILNLQRALEELKLGDYRDGAAVAGSLALAMGAVSALIVLMRIWVAGHKQPLIAVWGRLSARFAVRFRPAVAWPTATLVAAMIGGAALRWLLLAGPLLLLFALAAVPTFGMTAADRYLSVSVFDVAGCVSQPGRRWSQAQLATGKPGTGHTKFGAQCVEVASEKNQTIVRGRLVMARGDLLVIYRPDQDDSIVVDSKATTVRSIARL